MAGVGDEPLTPSEYSAYGGFPVVMLSKPERNTTAVHKKAGNYFLDIKAANLESWTLKIEEKK